MRIISGFHKNRKINAPKSLPVRPTTDLAKESLFNIINNTYNIEILNVLNLPVPSLIPEQFSVPTLDAMNH